MNLKKYIACIFVVLTCVLSGQHSYAYTPFSALPADTVVASCYDTKTALRLPFCQDPAATESPNFYIKTNIPAWAMLWMNVQFEIDFEHHFSAQVPVYYSGFNYFTTNVKFRTLTFMPEVRYWVKSDNMGFFVNAHFGFGWYNYAKGGEYRYQDHNHVTPAIGGGVGIGYRFRLPRNPHWIFEAGVGGGAYWLDYDIYENRHNGPKIGRCQRMFYGIDQAFFSIGYAFNLKKEKKGGSR